MSRRKNMSRITEDLIRAILLNLPAESIHRFRTVCKSWRKLIESPSFIKAQVEKTAGMNTDIDNRLIVVPESDRETLYSVVFPCPGNLNVVTVKKLDYPSSDPRKKVNLIGTCKGLICLQNLNLPPSFTLWNPSTGIYRIIDDKSNISQKMIEIHAIDSYCYFGYDHVKDDYNIVRVATPPRDDDDQVDGYISDVYSLKKVISDVYSLKNDSWTTKIHNLQDQLQNEWVICQEFGVIISTTLYLLVRWDCNNGDPAIIAFDISTQTFGTRLVELPSINHDHLRMSYYDLCELHGCLSVIVCEPNNKHVVWLMMNNDEGGMKKIEFQTSKSIYISKLIPYSSSSSSSVDIAAEQLLVLGHSLKDEMIWFDLKAEKTRDILVQIPAEYCLYPWESPMSINSGRSTKLSGKYGYLVGFKACFCLSTIASPFIV